MKTIIFTIMVLSFITISAQKANLSSLPEKEREEYLLKTAYETVMKYGPDWYRDYKEPVIGSIIIDKGYDKGRKIYSVTWYYDPQKEKMEWGFAVGVGVYADTGEVREIGFGDGTNYNIYNNNTKRVTPHVHPFKKYTSPFQK